MTIPFIDLSPLHGPLATDLHRAFLRVANRGVFLNGPEVEEFEAAWAKYCGAPYCVACGSGTDALAIIAHCSARGAFTIQANTCAFTLTGLIKGTADDYQHRTIGIIDCDKHGCPNTDYCWTEIEDVGTAIPVDALLYGRTTRRLSCGIVDACQAHGWKHSDCDFAAWSFYPTKNLGAFGDGGAVTMQSALTASQAREFRDRLPSRLSEMNAAILLTKLPHLDEWNADRLKLAEVYWSELPDWTEPVCRPGEPSNHHIFAILVDRRDRVKQHLEAHEIGTKIHYPMPLADLPGANRWCSRVLSLPLWVGMTPEQVRTVCDVLKGFPNATSHLSGRPA